MNVVYLASHVARRSLHDPRSEGRAPSLALRWMPWLALVVASCALAWAATHDGPEAMLGMCVDRVTSAVALLVAAIGVVTFRYAERCLEGHEGRGEFLGWMAATIGCAAVLAMADSLPLLVGAWFAVGSCLDRLLRFFRGRPDAAVTARRALTLGRIGDALLIAACAVAWSAWGATSVTATAAAAAAAEPGAALTAFSLLLCAAVIVKSAQVPVHGWLPETMEAPTPVSALMHAGIVNAGGALLIRMAPAVERVPESWLLLSAFGTLSILVATPTVWVQARAKTALAWSTVSQMGFMLVQCALCAFPAALLHIIGHGLYKAWSFLRAGEVPPQAAASAPCASRALALLLLGTLVSAASLWEWARVFGLSAGAGAGKVALLVILAIAAGQSWMALLGRRRASIKATLARAAASLAFSAAAPALACALYALAAWWIGRPMPGNGSFSGAAAWVAAGLPVAAISALAAAHAAMPALERARFGARLRIHALSGFYLGIAVYRVTDRIRDFLRTTTYGVNRA